MLTNLELKIKVKSHTGFENLLRKIRAEYRGTLKQKDIYYHFKKGLLKLRIENGSNSMIKYLRDEKGKRWSNYEILNIQGKNPEKYLSEILTVEAIVEKKRKLYLFKGTRIHLDNVKRVGKFLELETVVNHSKKDAEKRFKEIIKLLKLDISKQINTSYKNLLMR